MRRIWWSGGGGPGGGAPARVQTDWARDAGSGGRRAGRTSSSTGASRAMSRLLCGVSWMSSFAWASCSQHRALTSDVWSALSSSAVQQGPRTCMPPISWQTKTGRVDKRTRATRNKSSKLAARRRTDPYPIAGLKATQQKCRRSPMLPSWQRFSLAGQPDLSPAAPGTRAKLAVLRRAGSTASATDRPMTDTARSWRAAQAIPRR